MYFKITIKNKTFFHNLKCEKFDHSMHANIIQIAQNQSFGFKGNINAFSFHEFNLIWIRSYNEWMNDSIFNSNIQSEKNINQN